MRKSHTFNDQQFKHLYLLSTAFPNRYFELLCKEHFYCCSMTKSIQSLLLFMKFLNHGTQQLWLAIKIF